MTVHKHAVISEDGVYRYSLERVWAADKVQLGWVMLNPSTADADKDDATIRKCMKYARAWGFGGIYVVNLFAFRASKPVNLPKDIDEATGPYNVDYVYEVLGAMDMVAAWGAHDQALASPIRRQVLMTGRAHSQMISPVLALGLTKHGEPRHPLYMKDDVEPVRWPEQ